MVCLLFAYCPLAWMFHSRELNHKINRIHERCLCVVYHHTTSSFKELLQKDNSVSILHINIQVLATDNVLSLQGDIFKNYDGGHPTEPTFELYHKTPT